MNGDEGITITIGTDHTFTVKFFGTPIDIILPSSPSAVENFISRYHPSEEQRVHLGLALQYNPQLIGRISTLQLCDRNRCLILQLNDSNNVPEALKEFLANPYVYVSGVGIYDDCQLLFDGYRISLAHPMELRNLASTVLDREDLFGCKRETLAELVLGLQGVETPQEIVMSNWDSPLTIDQCWILQQEFGVIQSVLLLVLGPADTVLMQLVETLQLS